MGILRLLLAISVVISHSTPVFGFKLVGGEVAVQTFYIISGFYMAMVLTEKYYDKSYKLFITNRLLRLYPAYWTILLISILFSFLSFFLFSETSSEKINAFILLNTSAQNSFLIMIWAFFANIFMIFQDWFMFLGIDNGQLNFVEDFHQSVLPLHKLLYIPQAWTIGVEISFYLLAPFLIKKSNKYLFSILLLSIIMRLILISNGMDKDPWTYRFFPNEIAFFIIGMLIYRLRNRFKSRNLIIKFFKNWPLMPIILLTFFYQFIYFDFINYLYPLFVAILIPYVFTKFKDNKLDLWIGELSYPIYISHITILILLQKISSIFSLDNGIFLVLFSIVFSIGFNRFITKPIEKIRQKRLGQMIIK